MALRDLVDHNKVIVSLSPAARNATGTGTVVDMQPYQAAMVAVNFGAWTDGTHTPSLQHSSDGTTYTPCDTNSLSGTFTAVSAAGGANTVQKVGYTGSYRYLRAMMTITGATTGALSCVNIVTSRASQQPV
jgi:hypothetical protein